MPSPIVFKPGISGLPLSGTDYNNNWGLVESSLLDQGPWVISGLVPTVGAGLAVNVSAGVAVIGAEITKLAFVIGSLTASNTNFLYLKQDGTATSNTTGIAPAASVLLGTALTGVATVTSVDITRASGRQQFVQPQNLVHGGSAGNPRTLHLNSWNATDGNGFEVSGQLPAGALPAGFSAPVTFTGTDAGTNNEVDELALVRRSSGGAAAAGFGLGIIVKADNLANTVTEQFALRSVWSTPTAGSEGSLVALYSMGAGAEAERLRIKESGQVYCIGPLAAKCPTATAVSANLMIGAGAATAAGAPLKFLTGPLLTATEPGTVEFLTPTVSVTPVSTRRALALVSDALVADVTVANTVTETLLFTGTIAANEMAAGKTFRVQLQGRYSALVGDTFQIKCKVGGTTFLTVTSVSAAVANQWWRAEFVVTCRTVGGAGTVISNANLVSNNLVTSAPDTGTHVVDTTAAENITMTCTWSAASASDTLTATIGTLEVLG